MVGYCVGGGCWVLCVVSHQRGLPLAFCMAWLACGRNKTIACVLRSPPHSPPCPLTVLLRTPPQKNQPAAPGGDAHAAGGGAAAGGGDVEMVSGLCLWRSCFKVRGLDVTEVCPYVKHAPHRTPNLNPPKLNPPNNRPLPLLRMLPLVLVVMRQKLAAT